MLRLDRLQDRTGVEIKMESGERKEAIQESPVVIKESLNEDNLILQSTGNVFYGGADLRAGRIRVISDKPITIE